jgi:hypothetical protein
MHPQLRPIMQLGPLGASVADVPGGGALCSTLPRAAPHPTIKTNRPALARSATSDLPMFVITSNCRRVVDNPAVTLAVVGDGLPSRLVGSEYRVGGDGLALPPALKFHALPQTHASLCVAAAIPPLHLSRFVGHANVLPPKDVAPHHGS